MDAIHTEVVNGKTIKMYYDTYPESPREWDNLGTMVCWHGRYNLGDSHDFSDPSEYKAWRNANDVRIELPLYLYDHSGITMRTTPFGDPWDSGQVGYIYVTADQLRKEYSAKRITQRIIEQATKVLEGEVKTYDEYLRGDVYGYVIEDADGNHVDSCWGFYGYDYCLEEARSIAAYQEAIA